MVVDLSSCVLSTHTSVALAWFLTASLKLTAYIFSTTHCTHDSGPFVGLWYGTSFAFHTSIRINI